MMDVHRRVSFDFLPILTLKSIAIATSVEPSENEGQIGNLRSNTYHMVDIW